MKRKAGAFVGICLAALLLVGCGKSNNSSSSGSNDTTTTKKTDKFQITGDADSDDQYRGVIEKRSVPGKQVAWSWRTAGCQQHAELEKTLILE